MWRDYHNGARDEAVEGRRQLPPLKAIGRGNADLGLCLLEHCGNVWQEYLPGQCPHCAERDFKWERRNGYNRTCLRCLTRTWDRPGWLRDTYAVAPPADPRPIDDDGLKGGLDGPHAQA